MKICKQCGAKIPDDSKTCPICGNKQLDEAIIMLCPSCGAINLSESKHCIKCGALLHEEEQQQPIVEKEEKVVETSSEGEEKIAKVCPNCGYVNSLGNRFCNMCGQPMFVKKEEQLVQTDKPNKKQYVEDVEEEYEDDYEDSGSRKNRLLNGISALFAIGFIVSLLNTWFLKKTGLTILLEAFKSLSKTSETIFGLGAVGRVLLLIASVITVVGGVLAVVNAFRGDKAPRFVCIASIVLTLAFGFSFLYFYQELLSSIGTAFYLGALSNILFGAIGLFTNDEYDDYVEDEDEDL